MPTNEELVGRSLKLMTSEISIELISEAMPCRADGIAVVGGDSRFHPFREGAGTTSEGV